MSSATTEHPSRWLDRLKFDPLQLLLQARDPGLKSLIARDLLDEDRRQATPGPAAIKLIQRQQADGSWRYPSSQLTRVRSYEDYDQIETYRALAILVEKHGLDSAHPAIQRAASFLFSRQAKAGDFRGIYGSQFTPNYSAAIVELLVKSGYDRDDRVHKGFDWLLANRQTDGGWAIPLRTRGATLDAIGLPGPPIERDPQKPSSWLVTGTVLRAFAAHPDYRALSEARTAANLLAAALFQRDSYPDRGAPAFWTRFSFPFWFTDLLSALDSLSQLGLDPEHPSIERALAWLHDRQDKDGVWRLSLLRMVREPHRDLWISFAVCRVFRRFYRDF